MNYLILLIPVLFIFIMGIKIVKSTQRGLVERHRKYYNYFNPGFHWINPVIDRLFLVNVSEQMVDTLPQQIITNDNLKVTVDVQVYFKVKADKENVIKIIYNFENYKMSILNNARVTLRNLIAPLTLESALRDSIKINIDLNNTLKNKIQGKGIEIIRTELMKIDKSVLSLR